MSSMNKPYAKKVWIGDCTLYLGDSMDILPTLGAADSIVSDPPYGMNYQSSRRTDKHDLISGDGDGEALRWICNLEATHSKYIFCRWDNLMDSALPKTKSTITWVKNNWGSGDLEHSHGRQTELLLFYAGDNHVFPKHRPSDVIRCAKAPSDEHPTAKPVDLMYFIVEWTSGLVLDPFMGSGTTGVACAKMGRKFIGIEREESYFEIACKRIERAYAQPDLFVAQPKEKPENFKFDL